VAVIVEVVVVGEGVGRHHHLLVLVMEGLEVVEGAEGDPGCTLPAHVQNKGAAVADNGYHLAGFDP
jgi:hypothetical protein